MDLQNELARDFWCFISQISPPTSLPLVGTCGPGLRSTAPQGPECFLNLRGHSLFAQTLPPALCTSRPAKATPGRELPPRLAPLSREGADCRQDDSSLCHPLALLSRPAVPIASLQQGWSVPRSVSGSLALGQLQASQGQKKQRKIRTDRRETGSDCPRAEDKKTPLLLSLQLQKGLRRCSC